MFTGQKIPFSYFETIAEFAVRVFRDCDFSYIGKIPSKVNPRVVPCVKKEHALQVVNESGIVGVITTDSLQELIPKTLGLAISDNPLKSAYLIHEFLCKKKNFHWISFPSRIASTAKIHPSAVIAETDVVVMDNCIVHPHAVLYPRTILGKGSSIGAGSIIGCDGFEVDVSNSVHRILPQAGGVRIGENVDIQANCTVSRATFGGFTELGDETKFDNMVHIAHDCQIGRRVHVTACSEISGRVVIGDDAYLGPNVSISNGVSIGEGAYITIGSVVVRDVPKGARVSGNFAIDHAKWINLMRKLR